MGKLHDIRVASDSFMSQFNVHVSDAIKSTENDLVRMNKEQMLKSQDSTGNALIHKSTGSEFLTPAYAKEKGKSKPNLKDTGSFQREMFLEVDENELSWFIDSDDAKADILADNYGVKIFGIKDVKSAKKLTGEAFRKLYHKLVLKK